MKAKELNINNLVIAANILANTVDYLDATTELNKAVSGRKTKEALISRILTLRELADMAGQGTDYTLTDHEVEIVNTVGAHYTSTITKLVEEKAPEGEELLVLPKWEIPTEPAHANTYWGTLNAAFLHVIAAKTNAQVDIKAFLDYLKSNQLPKGFPIAQYTSSITEVLHRAVRTEMDIMVAKEFKAYLNVSTWQEMGNAIEKLVNENNSRVRQPVADEVTLTLADFDRINTAVGALYPAGAKTDAGRREDESVTPMPRYARRFVNRQPTIQLKLAAGKITAINFTDL